MRIRFQADNDLNKAHCSRGCPREPAIDLRSAQAAGLDHVPDPEVLMGAAGAALQRRVLISHDFQTMPEHFKEFVRERRGPGVFLIPQNLPIWLAVETLILVWPPQIN